MNKIEQKSAQPDKFKSESFTSETLATFIKTQMEFLTDLNVADDGADDETSTDSKSRFLHYLADSIRPNARGVVHPSLDMGPHTRQVLLKDKSHAYKDV
jgi:hypothetical protein